MSLSTALFRKGNLSYRFLYPASNISTDSQNEGKLSRKGKFSNTIRMQSRKMSSESVELFREGNLSYRILTPEHRDAALIVLARSFVTEPVCSALGEIKPEMKTNLHDWVEFIDYWMDDCASNGLSTFAMDVEKGSIVGVLITRDLLMVPPGFKEKYTSDRKTLSPWMNFLWHMDAEATKKMPELGEPGKAVDFWMGGVHPDYRGNKIFDKIFKEVIPLTRQAGFKYATAETTSAFTAKTCLNNDFTPVHEEEAAKWLWHGKPLYTNAKKPHGTWKLWVKDLQTDSNSA